LEEKSPWLGTTTIKKELFILAFSPPRTSSQETRTVWSLEDDFQEANLLYVPIPPLLACDVCLYSCCSSRFCPPSDFLPYRTGTHKSRKCVTFVNPALAWSCAWHQYIFAKCKKQWPTCDICGAILIRTIGFIEQNNFYGY
jgi:hypothetical protein